MKKTFVYLVLLAGLSVLSAFGSTDSKLRYQLINNPLYESNDLAVASYNLMDYGVDNTGQVDCTDTINMLLQRLNGASSNGSIGNYKNITGGILYIPAGRYLVKGKIVVPRGVTIRGDWRKPDGQNDISGTILVIKPDSKLAGTTKETDCAVTMQPTSEVSNLSFWYPDQDADNVTAYPPTIVFGCPGYWGNDYCSVRHVTFFNSYIGIFFSQINSGGCPNIFDVYGTPLYQGIVVDNIADVGRFDGIHFGPKYWASSGLKGSPTESQARNCVKSNATGIVMRRNDWSYTCNYDCDGYKVGYSAEFSQVSKSSSPNGHNYGFRLNDCETGIMITASSSVGMMFTRVDMTNCDTGIMAKNGNGPVQFFGCSVQGNNSAVYADVSGGISLMFQQCDFKGKTEMHGSQLTSVNCTYDGDVTVYPMARSIFTSNTFTNGKFINKSIYECEYSEEHVPDKALPEYKQEWMEIKKTRPARAALYVVTDEEFGAKPVDILTDLSSQPDNSAAIQRALDKAASEGGGIVYLPPGHYRMDKGLTIRRGVELKGAGDIGSVPKGNGSILEVYGVNEGNENADAFIMMEENSGLRGVHFNYPNQKLITDIKKYPYTIRGNKNCYIVNVAARTAYRILDLFTNKCDNHYVDYLAGHAYMNVVRVGGGSENGIISNIQCNTIAYACGDESKFGSWPNSESCKDDKISGKVYGQNKENLDFLIVGDCKGEVLYNNFLFGCLNGMSFQKDNGRGASDVHALGNAVDGAVNTIVINGLETDLDLINSQIVAVNHNKTSNILNTPLEAYFVSTSKELDKTVSFFSADFWGGGDYMVTNRGGTVNFYLSDMATSGGKYTVYTSDNGKVNIVGSYVNAVNKITQDVASASHTSFYSTIVDKTGKAGAFAADKNNLPSYWSISDNTAMLSRSGWVATSNKNNANARKAIDGNANTRWSTDCAQKDAIGTWFNINMNANCRFNAIILNSSNSSNDGPAAYKVEVYNNGGWHEMLTGNNGAGITTILFDQPVSASQVRITLLDNGKGGYWSVHELYLAMLDVTMDIKALLQAGIDKQASSTVEIFTLSGMKIATIEKGKPLPRSLGKGVYIVRFGNGLSHTSLKVNL